MLNLLGHEKGVKVLKTKKAKKIKKIILGKKRSGKKVAKRIKKVFS